MDVYKIVPEFTAALKQLSIVSPNPVSLYNYYALMIMGSFFEITGATLVSMEAIGIQRFKKVFHFITIYTKWVKQNLFNMFLSAIPFFAAII